MPRESLRVLAVSNLFPSPWDPLRAAFNRQQFERLATEVELEVLAAVDFRDRLRRRPVAGAVTTLPARWFTYVYPPGMLRFLHPACFLASLLAGHGRRLRRAPPDCILASWAFPDAVGVARLARWLGVPYVAKVHGSDINVAATHALRRGQIARALAGAAAVVAVSRALAGKVEALGVPRERIHVLYNGVDLARFGAGNRAAARAALGIGEDVRVLLAVGNLKLAKGCVDLAEAYARARPRLGRALLVYAGDGPDRGALVQRLAALGLGDEVRLVGAMPHERLGGWYRAADLLCLASHNEGVPNVVLEAMAHGLPVVATRVGGIPEVLPEFAGLLVEPRAVEALAEALCAAVARGWDAGRIAAHGRGFSWERNVAALREVLAGAAGAGARAVAGGRA